MILASPLFPPRTAVVSAVRRHLDADPDLVYCCDQHKQQNELESPPAPPTPGSQLPSLPCETCLPGLPS